MPSTCAQGRGPVRALATALAVTGALALAPAAIADTTTIAPTGSGVTAPAGIARDSNGAMWVADALRGICKVNPALPGGDALMTDGTWCHVPPVAGVDVPVIGPQAPFQMAYDAPSSTLFVAEGASHSMGVWRFHIDPATSTITSGTKIVFESDRVFGLAIGKDSGGGVVVDYSTKRSSLIHQVPNAVTCSPCAPIIAGSAQTVGAPSLAVLGTSLYIAEAGIVTRLDNPGPTGGVAQPIAGFPGGFSNALAVDPARGRVYAGTANGLNPAGGHTNPDQVDVLTPSNGAVETYATDFSNVTGLSVDPDGTLLVGDDASLVAETANHARLFAVGLGNLGTPKVTIAGGPGSFSQSHNVLFTFTTAAGMSFECRFDAGATDPWQPCGTGPSGSFSVASAGEGPHTFEVRAVNPDPAIGPGTSQKRTFVVDGTAPGITVDNPSSDATLAPGVTSMTLRFSSNDGSATFACSLDGQAPLPCSDPKTYTGLTAGDHFFTVSATDAAGNAGTPATFRFTVTPAPAAAPAPSSRTAVPSKPAGPAGATAPRLTSALKIRSARLIRTRTTVGKLRSRRRIVVRLATPARARAVTLALWQGTKGTVPATQASLRVTGGRTQDVVLTLTGRVAQRLHRGAYLVGVTLGDGGSLYGPARFLRLTVKR